jgi:hypothetical protein
MIIISVEADGIDPGRRGGPFDLSVFQQVAMDVAAGTPVWEENGALTHR